MFTDIVGYTRMMEQDERATLVRTSFLESRIDYAALFKHLRNLEADIEARFPVTIHLTGQPMLFGWSYAFATEILLIFAATVVLSVLLLWTYFRRLFGVFLPSGLPGTRALAYSGRFGHSPKESYRESTPLPSAGGSSSRAIDFPDQASDNGRCAGCSWQTCGSTRSCVPGP